MSIEIICRTLIQQLFLNTGTILDSIRPGYNLRQDSISIRYFRDPRPHVMLHITPPDTNYRLSANFKIEEGRIIFNIKKPDEDTGLLFEYIIDNGVIKHIYKIENSTPPRMNNSSVFSSVFVKFSNPYYTINKILDLIPNSVTDKPNVISISDSLEVVRYALEYVNRLKNLGSKLLEIRLKDEDIRTANEVFSNAQSKKTFDNKLRLKYAFYSRFMRRNIKVYYPEQLHEIPKSKENYVTNNFYTNVFATRYGDYYEDIREVFNKKFMISQDTYNKIRVEEYIVPLDFRFQKPFTTTDIFLHYFGRRESSMERYNLTTVDNIKKLFNHVELTKSIMFTFVSLYMTIPKSGANTINLNLKIQPVYSCLSWAKTLELRNIVESNITIDITISQRTGTIIRISECKKKCNPLVCMDVIEIPYKNEILPIFTKKMHLSKYPNYKNKLEQIYKSLLDNRNIPISVYKDSIEGAILLDNINERFIALLRKKYYDMDDFTNQEDETVLVSNEYKELTEEEFRSEFPSLNSSDPDVDTVEIIPQEKLELDDKDDDIEEEPSAARSSYTDIMKVDRKVENNNLETDYFKLLIEKIKLQIEYNKLSKSKMLKSQEYNKKKLQIKNLKEEVKMINRDLNEEQYIDYDEESNPDKLEEYYAELEQYRDELFDKLYELEPIYNKLSGEYRDLVIKIKRNTMMFLSVDYKIKEMIKINPTLQTKIDDNIKRLEQEERNTRLIIEYIEPIKETIDEDIEKGKQALDELDELEDSVIDIGYGSSISRIKQTIIDGLSDVAKGLIAVKNKAIKSEIELPLNDKFKDDAVDAEIKKLQLKQEQALKRIEEERRAQIKLFTRADERYKSELKIIEEELNQQRELEDMQQNIESRVIIEKMKAKLKLEGEYKKDTVETLTERLDEISQLIQSNEGNREELLEEERSINQIILQTQQNDEIILEREAERKRTLALELLRLETEEAELREKINRDRLERSLSWEVKIRKLEQYIEFQEAKIKKIPTIHKYRGTIYRLTILIRNAQRLLNNERALRSYNEKITKLSIDYETAKATVKSTEELLKSPNKQLRRAAFTAVKNEKIIQDSIEQIEKKMDTIKKFIKAQRQRHNTVGAIKRLPDVDEALAKQKTELLALLKSTKAKVKL